MFLFGLVLFASCSNDDNKAASATEAQMQALEDALAARDRQNADLTAQVEALQANPAEDSHAVIDDNSKHEPQTPFDEFVQTVNDAKRLHALVP